MTRLDARTAARFAVLNGQDAPGLPKPSKYNNEKTVLDGVTFDSKAEANHYEATIKKRLAAGEITDLVFHPRFVLQEGFRDALTKEYWRKIEYIGDFGYTVVATGRQTVDDTKGVQTEAFRIKRKLFRRRYPEIELRVIETRRRAKGGR